MDRDVFFHMASLWFNIPISSRKDEMNFIVAQHITFCNTGFYALNQSRNTSEFYLNTDFPFNSVKKTKPHATGPLQTSLVIWKGSPSFYQQHMGQIKNKLQLKSRLITDSWVCRACFPRLFSGFCKNSQIWAHNKPFEPFPGAAVDSGCLRGVITFSPLEGHLRGHHIMFYLPHTN